MKTKICGMREPENIKEVLKLEPDFMGFIFYEKSPRFVEKIEEISQINFGKTQKIAVFVNESLEKVTEIAEKLKVDFIQLHGSESSEYCQNLQEKGLKIIKVFAPKENFDFEKLNHYENYVEYFLFDTPTKDFGGSGKQFDWTILKSYKLNKEFLLSGGIGLENIEEVLDFHKKVPFLGIDVNSKFEIKPALKNIELLKKLQPLLASPKERNF